MTYNGCVNSSEVLINICDLACKNRPCRHKLHRVIFLLISLSKCSISIPYTAEESPLNSTVVMKICCGSINSYKVMIEENEKIGNFCAHMVNFCRPGHIYYV